MSVQALSVPVAPLAALVGATTQVPLVDGSTRRYANLDIAASAPALEQVAAAVAQLTPYWSSVHRGAGYLSRLCTAVYEQSRAEVASFVGARADDVVVFTRNTTDALGLLASAVPGEVVVLDVEHHANLLPWQRRGDRIVRSGSSVEETLGALQAELARRPTALLSVTGASNVTGECLPLRRLADLAHAHGARLAVDGAQLVPHRRVDLAATGVDYLAFSGHKLYAPYGAGALVGRRDWLDTAEPYLAGGGAVREVRVEATEWTTAPARHEGGTPNVLGVAALAAAARALGELRDGALEAHEHALTSRLSEGLASLGIRTHRIWHDATDVVGIVTFSVPGRDPGEVAAYLSAEHGIGVRDGRFCAHPLLARLGTAAAVRVSVGLGTSSDDVERLLDALRTLLEDGPSWGYARSESGWAPVPETRALPSWLGGASLAGDAPACEQP
ncbi:selenocysteine lyase/cysteine desulfurase [Motilibacter peucedani]|uniref:Selenocysteine lyase/cysteine desulfurase n=1 Tax=Motilibacter peucedani TaxID=598650 RepID=A0A420XKB0_9ACTN|nr:aminotransferase class V-fold PLP-dependent enzyme [Motilibacter peucedani]RKS68450.1 selenocysteine lyase/cysteine desulfurase [Motilibacter peucedani]